MLTHPIMKYFHYEHLPEKLQAISEPFHAHAARVVQTLPDNDQRARGLQKLIEAKDCFVRAALE